MTKTPDVRLSRLLEGLKASGVEHGARNKTVSEKAKYSENTVLKVLSGNSPLSPRFVHAVCDAFGVDYRWVMEGMESAGPGHQENSQGATRHHRPHDNVDMLVFQKYGGVVSEILGIVKLMTKEDQINLLKDLGARGYGSDGHHGR